MTDDDLMDYIHDHPATARMIARHFGRSEWQVLYRLRRLIKSGLVEIGPRRPLYPGAQGHPPNSYQLKRTKAA